MTDEVIVGRVVLEPGDIKGGIPPRRMEIRALQGAIIYGFFVLALAAAHVALGKFVLRTFFVQLLSAAWFLIPAAAGRAQRAMIERSWLKGYGQKPLDTEYSISPEAIGVSNHARDLQLKFSLVRYYVEQASHFVLYAAGQTALMVVPKRAFAEDELTRLRALFVERLQPAKSAVLTVTPRSLFRPLLWVLAAALALFVVGVAYNLVMQG